LVLRRPAVGGELADAGGGLALEAAHALLEELVEVTRRDRGEKDAFQKGRPVVERLVQDPPVEVERTELAIEIEVRMVSRRILGNRARRRRRAWCRTRQLKSSVLSSRLK
jgi:hypothetical protein